MRSADTDGSRLATESMLAGSRGVAFCTAWLRLTGKLRVACVKASGVFHVKHQPLPLSGSEFVPRSHRQAAGE